MNLHRWQSALISLMALAFETKNVGALVVKAPGICVETTIDKPSEQVEIKAPLSLRLRSTREDDLNGIASLLASARVNTDESQWNWKTSMNVLRNKSVLYTLLSHRFRAIKEGEKAAAKLTSNIAFNEADQMRLLWSHDSFRNQLEKAVTMAAEPHIWKQHDFAVCPKNPNSLRHAMITAEDRTTGNVVGFCEVAMMAPPPCHQHDCTSTVYAPTIANLVASSKYRRQGIASALLKSAKRYVHCHWSHDEITLYVEKVNKGAISLYSKQGFRPKGFGDSSEHDGSVYMTQSLRIKE